MSDQWKLNEDIFGAAKYIDLQIKLTDDLGVQSVSIMRNDTDIVSDSKLLELVAFTILKGLRLNKDSILVQDLLIELDIQRAGS